MQKIGNIFNLGQRYVIIIKAYSIYRLFIKWSSVFVPEYSKMFILPLQAFYLPMVNLFYRIFAIF